MNAIPNMVDLIADPGKAAGVLGQFLGQSARKPKAEGRNQYTCRALRKKGEEGNASLHSL